MGQFNWRVGNVSRQSNIVKIELSTLKLYNEKNHARQILWNNRTNQPLSVGLKLTPSVEANQ